MDAVNKVCFSARTAQYRKEMISYVCDNADMAFLLSKKMPADRICKGAHRE